MAGLLGDFTLADLTQSIDSRKRTYANLIGGLLSDPGVTLAQLAAKANEGVRDARRENAQYVGRSVMPEVQDQADQRAMALALNAGGLLGITAFHGSPHTFDKFDMSKIGTGEGAQAYGHGLYFAQDPMVAESYYNKFDRMVKADPEAFAATPAAPALSRQEATRLRAMQSWDPSRMTAAEKKQLAALEAKDSAYQQAAEAAIPRGATMYKVDIPDDAVAKMLDWDKPLSQQPAAVKAALRRSPFAPDESVWQHYTGKQLYEGEANAIGPYNADGWPVKQAHVSVSEMLRKAGIPGIRYLDAGSRGLKAGTSNFVLFDDQLPKIIGRE